MQKKVSLFAILLCLACFVIAKDITIFHTSDVHGFYFPRNLKGNTIGGFAALAGYINNYKQPYLLLDSGDFSSGTLETKKSNGALSISIMKEMGYNAATIGNHEGDFGIEPFLKNIQNAKFDILAINIYDKQNKTYPQNVKPYKTYMIDSKKIAVIGVAKDPLPKSNRIKTSGARKNIKKALKELQ